MRRGTRSRTPSAEARALRPTCLVGDAGARLYPTDYASLHQDGLAELTTRARDGAFHRRRPCALTRRCEVERRLLGAETNITN
ncbi:MAG: hypothetical protein ACLSVD_01790 [Eggerthellaceae bacterium]